MRLYDTLSRTVTDLLPADVTAGERPFGMYVCGPTVQDAPHFGHARAALVPDVLRRYLEWTGVRVLHVRNITDIEDKIINRATQEGRMPAAVAEEYTRVYERQMERLGILPPHVAPRATGHILGMQELTGALIESGSAYEAGGDVFFAVRSFPAYGRLSGRDIDELQAGARVQPDERKRDPLDFVLWKAAKPGEPSWPSPWGPGRPGWHIECSVMAAAYLGRTIDLHTGGNDLIFPHHENEIAQTEAATGVPLARHWLHNGMLTIDEVKMSKSLGNFITLQDALDAHGGDALRLYFLQSHYRSPVNFSGERLAEVQAALGRLRTFLAATADAGPARPAPGDVQRFRTAMEDDLGTPQAVAVIFDAVTAGFAARQRRDAAGTAQARATVLELAGVLGLDLADASTAAAVEPLVEALLELREQARQRGDFTTADAIRDRIQAAGLVVEDTPEGVRWHAAAT